jgi:hypothetical protein
MKKPTITKIKDKLQEFGIEIYKEFKTKDGKEDVIVADKLTVTSENNDVFISFNIDANPSYSARIMLILKEIKGIRDFCVGEDFIIDKNGKFIDGQDAINYYRKYQQEAIINEYMNHQAQVFYLSKAKHYHC